MSPLNKDESILYLRSKGWSQFYNDNAWVNFDKGFSDYNCIHTAEAFCREFHKPSSSKELFELVKKTELSWNEGKKLYIVGKSFEIKDKLRTEFGARYDGKLKKWYVAPRQILDDNLHDLVYKNRCSFQWEK